MEFRITEVEKITVDVPFTETAERNMIRNNAGWSVSEILRVKTNVGLEGIGETMIFYTWAKVPDAALKEVIGKNPFDLLWRDDLGAGLQIAMWDLAGKYAGVPAYALVGNKVRDAAPIAWWCIDMPPEDWAIEAGMAVEQGYNTFKLKGRPWFDIVDQVGAVCEVVPESFLIDVDFNGHLLDADTAIPTCLELEKRYPNLDILETPIPQQDVAGNVRMRKELRSRIVHHFGSPNIVTAVKEGVCDGFVLCAGARRLISQAHTSAELDMPFWIQLVGTGITTTWANHLGAALSHATMPAITCMNLYTHQLITDPIVVKDGHAAVRETPGLGIELDEDAVAKYRVEPPVMKEPPKWIHVITYDSGMTVYYGDYVPMRADYLAGKLPASHRGVALKSWVDDGTEAFAAMHKRVQDAPVIEGGA
ncbi:MAG: mandelate racemase/muconate lactonizing enzyme family protein [Candidatus Poribacteria bacterium]|nr:mandelate racemase/muconate lactonizing enzyme family protein [Candidatus Poribacteria bacterium]